MSLIERAAERLEELRRSGIEIPDPDASAPRRTAKLAQRPISRQLTDVTEPQEAPVPSAPQVPHTRPTPIRTSGRPRPPRLELDLAQLAAQGFITPDLPRSRIANEFRNLKRTLIANAAGKTVVPVANGNLVMVTSSVPHEGKTFSAVNLAMSIATELDRTVLLVDADVARPSLPRTLGVSNAAGLLDVLSDDTMDLSEVLVRTSIDKLTLLPSGGARDNATELLASDAMYQLLTEISERYTDRMIVFDSPPLLLTTESRVLATHMGQVVFVVRAESTLQKDVLLGLSTIDACPVKMMLLNQARNVAHAAYGYGYQPYGT
jgi:exopolysaccharide/PEP-CTERM locus tyrosine autokinase